MGLKLNGGKIRVIASKGGVFGGNETKGVRSENTNVKKRVILNGGEIHGVRFVSCRLLFYVPTKINNGAQVNISFKNNYSTFLTNT